MFFADNFGTDLPSLGQKKMTRSAAWACATLLWCGLCFPLAAPAEEWTDWRGPLENRHAAADGVYVDSFDPEKGTNILWKNEEAGGISTPVIMGGKLFTLVRHKPGTTVEAEKLLCLDATTGK